VKTLPLAEAKTRLSALVEDVHALDDEVTITRNGRAVAVLVSAGAFESWKETVDILGNPALLKEIKAGLRALKARKAKLYTLDELLS
jgi:antitoxin YefM